MRRRKIIMLSHITPQNREQAFLLFATEKNAILFGEFQTKAGRSSPYFFNAGKFCDGSSLGQLANFYADAILASGIEFDMLYGPAYKGIPLVSVISVALAQKGYNFPFVYNRKEVKDHGEGGITVGAPLQGRVLIIDDVISAGTSVRESIEIIRAAGAVPSGLVISLDRQERGQGELSAVQEVNEKYGIPTVAIAALSDLIFLIQRVSAESGDDQTGELLGKILAYRKQYGV